MDDTAIPLSAKQLLLKGAKIKNTDWAIGIVVYTGLDTKIMRNANESQPKMSNIERTVNRLIVQIIIFEFLLAILNFIFAVYWNT